MPDRRTLILLGSLLAAMTFTSGILLLLEPGSVTPRGITLQSIDPATTTPPAQRLFNTTAPINAKRWSAIVIHDSGSLEGSAKTINARDTRLGRGGLGYHFVINNGTGQPDGLIEVGFRWRRQFVGAYLAGKGSAWFNQHAIGISLIGNTDRKPPTKAQMRELVWLVQHLQAKFHIPPRAVFVDVGSVGDTPNDFPMARFSQQLLTPGS